MTKKVAKELQYLADHYKVELRIQNLPEEIDGRSYWVDVQIASRIKTRDRALSVFFHELGHIHCRAAKLWQSYHKDIRHKSKPLAERWVDNWAKKQLTIYDPRAKFIPSYP